VSFFYTREPGPEGQIITGEGQAAGVCLSDLLQAGPLPVRAALELLSYTADIVTIAIEDRLVHGDIRTDWVRLDEGGAITIDGWGASRRQTPAPEGAPQGGETDVYLLGLLLHATLAREPMGPPPRGRDAHDDYIVDRLMQLDWQELSDKRWMDEVLHFLCSMLAHDPRERPAPLDVANILSQVVQQAPGEDLTDFAERVVGAAASPRRGPAVAAEEEDLGGPQSLSAPMTSTSALRLRQAASAKGESTAFWSRDRIKAMLADEEEDEAPLRQKVQIPRRGAEPPPPPPPAAPRPVPFAAEPPPAPRLGAAAAEAPEPPMGVRPPAWAAPPAAPPRPPPAAAEAPPPPAAWSPPPAPAAWSPPPAPAAWSPPPAEPAPAPPPPPGAWSPPPAPVAAASPFAPAPAWSPPGPGPAPVAGVGAGAGDDDAPPPEAPVARGGVGKVVVAVAAALALLCGGAGLAGAAWVFTQGEGGGAEAPADAPADADDAPADAGDGEGAAAGAAPAEGDPPPPAEDPAAALAADAPPTPAPEAPPPRARTPREAAPREASPPREAAPPRERTPSPPPREATPPRERPREPAARERTPPAPAPAPEAGPSFPAQVRFNLSGVETTLECSPGGRTVFSGSTTLTIDDITTCRVITESGRTVVQLRKGGTVNCSLSGDRLACNGP
jgi:hypothetical protein